MTSIKPITKKSLLYRSGVEYADFCINHVLGCSHGCKYPCYAMMMAKRFGQIKDYDDWRKPRLVKNALELLDKEIPKYKNKIHFVHLSFTTDPFMYKHKDVADLTLDIIKKLNSNGIRCTVLTKGKFPKKLGDKKIYSSNNEVGITLVSLNEKFKKRFEPFSAPVRTRIKSLKRLHDAGLRTWVSIEPYPTPNLIKQELLKILKEVSFVDKIIFGRLNYNTKAHYSGADAKFYDYCARTVVDFCKKNKIEYHIKYGTQKKDNHLTEKLFNKK